MTRDTDLIRRGDAPERIWLTTTETGKVDDFTRWTDQPPRKCDLWDTEYIRAKALTPAPVVPAEGLDALQRRAYSWQVEHEQGPDTFRDVRNNPAHAHEMLESAHVLIDDLASALRSAPPVGARVRPWETRPADPDAMIPATVEVHRGAWAVVIGTNGKPAGWIDTHDLFANQLYRDHILTTPAALLPAGEGE